MTEMLEDRLRLTAKAIAVNTTIPPAPTAVSAPRRQTPSKRRSVAIAAAAIGAFVAVGVPVASAAGVPHAISAAFGWNQSGPITAEETTGRLLLTLPGPDARPMQLYEADAVGGGQCVTILLPDAPNARQAADAGCTSKGAVTHDVDAGATISTKAGTYMILYGSGANYLTLADGITLRRFPIVDGLSEAWLPAVDFNRTLTLSGYSTTGAKIGHFTFNQGPPP